MTAQHRVPKEVFAAISALEDAVFHLSAANANGLRHIGALVQLRAEARDRLFAAIQTAIDQQNGG